MLNHVHNLRFSPFVGRFQSDKPLTNRVFLESLLEFALGLAGAKNED